MRVKLQLVLCHDDGREETVTDIVSLKKDCHRIEHLGLTLADSKQLLKQAPCGRPSCLAPHTSGYRLHSRDTPKLACPLGIPRRT
jgi:hypothetical protein